MKVGITGPIASGKSLTLKYFQAQGWGVIDCDYLNNYLLNNDQKIRKILKSKWGNKLFNTEGKLDKAILAAIVFKNKKALKFLENLLHPQINFLWIQKIKKKSKEWPHWIVEIPLLFEKNLQYLFDYTICIITSLEKQKTQLVKRNISVKEAMIRMKRQMPIDQKIECADFIITNDGSKNFLKQQVDGFINHRMI